jgi:hypothetical protein
MKNAKVKATNPQGMVGGRSVNWLRKIEIAEHESESWYHFHDNRLFPEHVKSDEDVEKGGWATHPGGSSRGSAVTQWKE